METPEDIAQLLDRIRQPGKLIPVGNRTKPALSQVSEAEPVSLQNLTGILDYQPSEFTFTARAGTPLAEIQAALADHGQYLPFDPPFAGSGATLGGTVAAGLNGPGAYRFGTIRDFLLGIQYLDGRGRLLRAGGKVVKNAAGFDLPKFMVGSLGRFGILTELTFKVFPCPPSSATIGWDCATIEEALDLLEKLSRGAWDLDAIELETQPFRAIVRIRGQTDALPARLARIQQAVGEGSTPAGRDFSAETWNSWKSRVLVKIPLTPAQISQFDEACAARNLNRAYGLGGNVAWLGGDDPAEIGRLLENPGLAGLQLAGDCEDPRLGRRPDFAITTALKRTLDPEGKFPE